MNQSFDSLFQVTVQETKKYDICLCNWHVEMKIYNQHVRCLILIQTITYLD